MALHSACSEQVHRNFTFPPSLWPDRELRKSHYLRMDHRVMQVPPTYQCSWNCLPNSWIAASHAGTVEVKTIQFSRCKKS